MLPTSNHQEIRTWAQRHSATPAEITGTADGTPAKLAFIFFGGSPALELKPISWEEFFARFDLLGLSMAWKDGQFDLVYVDKGNPQKSELEH